MGMKKFNYMLETGNFRNFRNCSKNAQTLAKIISSILSISGNVCICICMDTGRNPHGL